MKLSSKSQAIENLREIIEVLRTIPSEQFNMEHWWLEDGMAWDEDRNVVYKVADGPCGCVVGHLIKRGLLEGAVIHPAGVPLNALPYRFRDRIWVQLADALQIYNYLVAQFLFDFCAYPRHRPISREDVIRRIELICSELAE